MSARLACALLFLAGGASVAAAQEPQPSPTEPLPAPPTVQPAPAPEPGLDSPEVVPSPTTMESPTDNSDALLAPPTPTTGDLAVASSEDRDDTAPQWTGPHVELGYTHYVLSDGHGAGSVNAGFFGGFLPLGSWPRLGASVEFGSRSYELGQDDLLLRGTIVAGYQHLGLDRFLPYAVLVGTMGPLFGKRYHTSISNFLVGAGVEIGTDVNIVENLYAGLGFAYIRATMWGLSYDLFIFRARIGL